MIERTLGEMEVPVEYEEYINLIRRIAHSYPANARCDFDDYVSVGMAAFAEIRKSFDPRMGVKLITYIYAPIKNAIEKEFQNNANALSGCTPYFINKSEEHRGEINFLNNTAISLSTSRKELGSFYDIIGHTSGRRLQPSLKEMIVESGENCPQVGAQRMELIEKVDEIIDTMNDEEQDIIYRRIFNEDTFQAIADAKDMTWRTVNLRFHKSMDKLRGLLLDAGLEIYAQ